MMTRESGKVDVSVVVCCFKQEFVIADVIEALTCQEFNGNFEIIVVEDCSPDGSLELLRLMLQQDPGRFRLIGNLENVGASSSRNLGAEKAQGDILLFLDGDLIVDQGYVQAHYDALIKGDEARICTIANIRYAEEFCLKSAFVRFRNAGYPGQCHKKGVNFEINFTQFGSGIMGIRRRDFLETGRFDESFRGYGFEDIDFGYRFTLIGGKIEYVKEAGVVHQELISIERHKIKSIEAYSIGLLKLMEKHRELTSCKFANFRLFTRIKVGSDGFMDLSQKIALRVFVRPMIAKFWERELILRESEHWNLWDRFRMRYVILNWYLVGLRSR